MRNTIEHQRHWDEKYTQGNTHADYHADTDLVSLLEYAPSQGLALDVACGTGRNSFCLAEHGLDVVCMDFSLKGLTYLKHHRSNEAVSKKILPVQADLTCTPLPDNGFDLVTVIRYLDRKAFGHYLDTLKPGGLLFFKAFNLNHLTRKPGFNPDYLLRPGELVSQFEAHEILKTNDHPSISDFESFILVRR